MKKNKQQQKYYYILYINNNKKEKTQIIIHNNYYHLHYYYYYIINVIIFFFFYLLLLLLSPLFIIYYYYFFFFFFSSSSSYIHFVRSNRRHKVGPIHQTTQRDRRKKRAIDRITPGKETKLQLKHRTANMATTTTTETSVAAKRQKLTVPREDSADNPLSTLANGIPLYPLPDPQPARDSNVPHAPVFQVKLSETNFKMAVRNALRYFVRISCHPRPAFAQELRTYGHIFMYRLSKLRHACISHRAVTCSVATGCLHYANDTNNLDPAVAQFPHELIT